MIDLRLIDEITRRLGDALPPGVSQAKGELENQFKSVLTSAFERMNLVGREEYDSRCAELEELRERLATLETRLDELS
ncbi:accessory factor UbiK family protein [Pseudomonadota bacterium]